MEKILVVSSNKSASEALMAFLLESFKCTPKIVESAYQARSLLESDMLIELVMVNSPLMDESGVEFAEYVTGNTTANCVLLIKEEVVEKAAGYGADSFVMFPGDNDPHPVSDL